jgi:hypothetical protein
MRLAELAERIGAEVVAPGQGGTVDVDQVYAGDRISDLLNAADGNVLLVSNLTGGHLLQVAGLLDVPAICLVSGRKPDAAMVRAAASHGTLLMVSEAGLFETCGRIHRCLAREERSG